MEEKILYKDLSYRINGILFKVQNELGRYSREKQYGDSFQKKLLENKVDFKREARISDSGNIADFIIEQVIVVELKAKPFVTKEDYYQIQRYLQSTGLKLGLLVNFRNEYLKPIRVIRVDR